jgi:hypothetical protein
MTQPRTQPERHYGEAKCHSITGEHCVQIEMLLQAKKQRGLKQLAMLFCAMHRALQAARTAYQHSWCGLSSCVAWHTLDACQMVQCCYYRLLQCLAVSQAAFLQEHSWCSLPKHSQLFWQQDCPGQHMWLFGPAAGSCQDCGSAGHLLLTDPCKLAGGGLC